MGKQQGKARDLFTQKAMISIPQADFASVRTAYVDTGLSIRGGLAWLLHKVRFYLGIGAAVWPPTGEADGANYVELALSTRKALAAMPGLTDAGVIDYMKVSDNIRVTTSGGWQTEALWPVTFDHLPPIPIAAPALSLYAISSSTLSIGADCVVEYTTISMDQAIYTEIAEVWGW